MKKTLLMIAIVLTPLLSWCQDLIKQKELGVEFSNFNNFGMTYRVGKPNSMYRFKTIFLLGSTNTYNRDTIVDLSHDYGAGVSIGKEFRKSIASKLETRIGGDAFFRFRYSRLLQKIDNVDLKIKNTNLIYTPGVNLVLGFNYLINDHLVLGAETLPSIYFDLTRNKYDNGTNRNVYKRSSFNVVALNNVVFSLVYRF